MAQDTFEIVEQLTDDMPELIHAIVTEAKKRFEVCGYASDFCLQCSSYNGITFGGWNRVTWNPAGWFVSASHCSETFLDNWNRHYGN